MIFLCRRRVTVPPLTLDIVNSPGPYAYGISRLTRLAVPGATASFRENILSVSPRFFLRKLLMLILRRSTLPLPVM
jgi:hypothetical protein